MTQKFKQKLIDESERKYGAEVREKYGGRAVKGVTQTRRDKSMRLFNKTLDVQCTIAYYYS